MPDISKNKYEDITMASPYAHKIRYGDHPYEPPEAQKYAPYSISQNHPYQPHNPEMLYNSPEHAQAHSGSGYDDEHGNDDFQHSSATHYQRPYPSTLAPEDKPNILNHFRIFPNIPTINILNICSIILLGILVEINLYVNLESSKMLSEFLGFTPNALVGVGIIGVFFGVLYRYADFEFEQLNRLKMQYNKVELKSYLKLVFMILIMIFILIYVITELIHLRNILMIIDLISISIMAFGTYAIFSGKRYIIIIPLIFLFLTMLLGIDHGEDLPMLTLLGFLTIIYIELTDGACRLQENILKYQHMAKEPLVTLDTRRTQIETQMEFLTIQFVKNLGIFIIITISIVGLLLSFYSIYSYLTPAYLSENLEVQTVYGLVPIIILLFIVFLFVYIFTRPRATSNELPINNDYTSYRF